MQSSPNQKANESAWSHEREMIRVHHGGNVIIKTRYGSNVPAFIRDLSENGVYIESDEKVSLGVEVLIYLKLNVTLRRSKQCIVSGTVVRLGNDKENKGFAVTFGEDLNASTLRKIQDHISTSLQQQNSH